LNIVLEGEFKLPIRLRVGNNKSIIGSSTGGTISSNGTIGSGGMNIINAVNVVVRNIKFNGVPNNDCITIQNATVCKGLPNSRSPYFGYTQRL